MTTMSWLKNMLGQKLTDEQMRDIDHPALELYTHVTFKTIQAGAIAGMIIIAPAVRLARGPRTMAAIGETAIRFGRNGAVAGVPLGPLLVYSKARSSNITEEGYFDRAYRLRYNRDQVRTDRASLAGTFGGLTGALALGASPVSGAVVGLVGATVLAGMFNATVGSGRHV